LVELLREAEKVVLRAYVEIDAMQPQWAAYVAQTCQGDPPHAGMAQLYVEVAPANAVFALVDVAVKNAPVRSALQVVERQYGTLELHGRSLSDVKEAGAAILERLGTTLASRTPPTVIAAEVVTRVDPNQAQLVNRMRVANLLLEGETMFLLELAPAAYVAAAANEAEKQAPVKLVYAATLGASGRLIVSGRDAEVSEAQRAALAAL
jgi:ethanolamine utilization microcompartment shell protein EutS